MTEYDNVNNWSHLSKKCIKKQACKSNQQIYNWSHLSKKCIKKHYFGKVYNEGIGVTFQKNVLKNLL